MAIVIQDKSLPATLWPWAIFNFVLYLPCFQVCYAKELKEGFVEYTEQVVKLMVPLLKFYFHDDILSLPK